MYEAILSESIAKSLERIASALEVIAQRGQAHDAAQADAEVMTLRALIAESDSAQHRFATADRRVQTVVVYGRDSEMYQAACRRMEDAETAMIDAECAAQRFAAQHPAAAAALGYEVYTGADVAVRVA